MIPLFKVHMPKSVIDPLTQTLLSGYIGQGPRVEEFERKLQPWVGTQYGVTVNAGTSALRLALRLAGVNHGDEVITTPMTCTATNTPILEQGARPVWADVQHDSGNIAPGSIKRKITKKTKAIICVHWGGYPCDLEEINDIGKKHRIPVIEDAAHALGAVYHGSTIGTHSDFVCFSFQAIKHLTTVDGGLLVCKSVEDTRRAKLLRWYGIDREGERKDLRCKEDIQECGYKYHMNDVAATIGIEQLNYIRKILAAHFANAEYFRDAVKGAGSTSKIKVTQERPDRGSSYWLCTFLVDDRDSFQEFMKERGVHTSQVHVRNDIHTAFAPFKDGPLPGVDKFAEHQVSVPTGWWLSPQDRETIRASLVEWARRDR